MKLSELANYLYLFGNVVRMLHLLSNGEEFLTIHAELEDIYNICFDFYDFACESAISNGESIINPSTIINNVAWNPIVGDRFDQRAIVEYVNSMGSYILGCVKQVTEYASWTQSKIDEFSSELDKIINYKFARILK